MQNKGRIDIICGPMFSGKTSELLRRLERLDYANRKYLLIKPKFDNRYSDDAVVSHSKKSIKSVSIEKAKDILDLVKKYPEVKIIAIDEAQFFGKNDDVSLFTVCRELKKHEYSVIINGLDMDSDGKPFGLMPELMAIADSIQKIKAVCMFPGCGEDAEMSLKLQNQNVVEQEDNVVELGEKDKYEARCFKHWLIGRIK
jgi:thymidine kinase